MINWLLYLTNISAANIDIYLMLFFFCSLPRDVYCD